MASRRAVLLTPSTFSLLTTFLSDKQAAPVSPLFVILQRVRISIIPRHLAVFCFHTLTHSFCTHQNFNSFLFKRFRTLFAKQGGGYPGPPFLKKYFKSHAATLTRSDSPKVPRLAHVLVHRYFVDLNRFCIRSPIVPWAPPGYTLYSTRRTSLTGSERRTTQRFSMRLPLTVRWTTGAAVGETSTESRDVSSRGVYFFLSKDVKEGSPVEILLTLPNEITLAGPVRVRCLGRVQRTEPREEGAVGVVAAIERYEFLRGEEERA